jgi:hypothetical protein
VGEILQTRSLKTGQYQGSRSIQKEPKYFKPLDIGEEVKWLIARSHKKFTEPKDLEEAE